MKCTQCGIEIVAWVVNEIWSGDRRELLNDDPNQICNGCAWGIDGILEYADSIGMEKFAAALPPLAISFEDYLKSIPGVTMMTWRDGFWLPEDDDTKDGESE